jgi:hypothetical protein
MDIFYKRYTLRKITPMQEHITTTTPTAAELLAEWKNLEDYRHRLRNDRDDRFASLKESRNSDKMDSIAAQLDQMADDWGIQLCHPDPESSLVDYPFFVYMDLEPTHPVIYDSLGEAIPIPATEQQALQEWLLIRKNQ